MKKRIISLICAILSVVLLLSACGGDNPVVTEPVSTDPIATEPPATEPPIVNEAPGTVVPTLTSGTPVTLDIKWHVGYVASYGNTSASKIIMDTKYYSYSDVITIPKAGTKISFSDFNKGVTDSSYATTDQYVVSLWKNGADGKWTLSGDMNYCGSSNVDSTIAKYDSTAKVLTYTYISKNDNENIRLCYRSGESATDKVQHSPVTAEVANGEQSTFDKFMLENKDFYDWLEGTKKTAYYSQLEGLTMNIIGDSYFEGPGLPSKYHVWPGMIAQKYKMNFINHGIGGSTISTFVTNKNPMVERYTKLPDNDPDIVILEGGRNDFNVAAPIGSNTDTDPKTFKGALNVLIDRLQEKYPNALIICVTVWNYTQAPMAPTGGTHVDYGNAMIEICKLQGVPCFNAMDENTTGVHMNSANFKSTYCNGSGDPSHLNLKGMKKVMPAFEKFIAEQWIAFNK